MLDSHTLFANQQEVSDGTGPAVEISDYVLDTGTPHGGIGTAVAPKLFEGPGQEVVVEVTSATNTGQDDFTFKAEVIAADNAALDSSPVVLATHTSATIAAASLPTALKPLVIILKPNGQTAAKRYYGCKFTTTGTGSTNKATVNAYIRGFGEHQTNLVP